MSSLFISLLSLLLFSLSPPFVSSACPFHSHHHLAPRPLPVVRQERSVCPNTRRRSIDGVCTNRFNSLWGSAGVAHFSYDAKHSGLTPTGRHLKSPRFISNALCPQSMNMPNARRLSEFVTFFGQFLDHTIVATTKNRSEPFPIDIPPDDPIFANFSGGQLPFHRSVRVPVYRREKKERARNDLPSFVDLSSVYGASEERLKQLRSFVGGRLKVVRNAKHGDFMPRNTHGFRNDPEPSNPHFFLAGDHRSNEHPVLTSLHTVFMREHNRLANQLADAFPDWTDQQLFEWARTVNIAQFQKIVFAEFYPALTGRRMTAYKRYNGKQDPTISLIFSTAAFRVGHTMVGNGISRRSSGMHAMPMLTMPEMFFRHPNLMTNGIEPFLRGAIATSAQEIDVFVNDALRNFLFHNVKGEDGFDLVAMNIQRGRDHALPSYNKIRQLMGRPPAKKFRQISTNLVIQNKLSSIYDSIDDVEAWPGLMAEDHMPGASMGKTLFLVWKAEFERFRDGDRFFYQQYRYIPPRVYRALPQLRRMLYGLETMREILLKNTRITEEEIGPTVWKVSASRSSSDPRGGGAPSGMYGS